MTDPAAEDLVCPDCGYSLRGIDASACCPECGWLIDRDAAGHSRIPWAHRAQLGRVRAYARTVALGTWRIGQLAAEVARPVDGRAARRFADVTAVLAALPVVAALVLVMWRFGRNTFNPLADADTLPLSTAIPPRADAVLPFAAGVTQWPVLPVCAGLTLWLIARVPSLCFALRADLPEQRRHRARELSGYTSAPLLFIPWAAVLYVLALDLRRLDERWTEAGNALILLSVLVGAFAVLLAWLNPLRLLRRTTQASGLRLIAAAIGLPLAWCLCAAAGLFAVPWVAGLVWLVIDSVSA